MGANSPLVPHKIGLIDLLLVLYYSMTSCNISLGSTIGQLQEGIFAPMIFGNSFFIGQYTFKYNKDFKKQKTIQQ